MRSVLFPCLILGVTISACTQPAPEPAPATSEPAAEAMPVPGSVEAKIAEAVMAGPASITSAATIMDWPAEEGGQPTQLRAGTNGWTCFPSSPAAVTAADQDPMCLDEPWLAWANAWTGRTTPQITRLGIGYMLLGDAGSSATDPYAMAAAPDNQWVESPPHLMIVVPDTKMLEGMPTSPGQGGPWVMWHGTQYAHIMVPVAEHR